MREENTNQQQAEAPRVSRVREYMTAKFPDRQFADEDDYENTLTTTSQRATRKSPDTRRPTKRSWR